MSRAVVIVCRDEQAARDRFGVTESEVGIVYTRTGRRFFNEAELERRFLVRLPGSVRVYTDAGSLVSTIHTTAQHAVLSPGGLGVATTKGNIAQLWDASTGRPLHTLKAHTQLINDAEYSPNGRELVTVSSDHTGRIWDTRSGRLRQILLGHFFAVNTGSFSPDGHWIVTTSSSNAVAKIALRIDTLQSWIVRGRAPFACMAVTHWRTCSGVMSRIFIQKNRKEQYFVALEREEAFRRICEQLKPKAGQIPPKR